MGKMKYLQYLGRAEELKRTSPLGRIPPPTFFRNGIAILKEAVRLDHEGEYPQALSKYQAGVEHLMLARKHEPSPEIKAQIKRKILLYMGRAEELKGPRPGTDA